MQVLLWNFTNTHPGDSVHNQKYYIQDLPAKPKGKVKIALSGMPSGNYTLLIFQTGYRVNDAYTSFLDMKKPLNLNREQLAIIKNSNNGAPIATISVQVKADGKMIKELDFRENDVFFLDIVKKK